MIMKSFCEMSNEMHLGARQEKDSPYMMLALPEEVGIDA